jgi:acetyl-CoA C-acetyltransferase
LWELNEALPRRCSLSCRLEDDTFCCRVLGLDGAAGAISRDKLNADGGAIGLGYPVMPAAPIVLVSSTR